MLMDPKSTPVVELSPRPGKGPLRKQKSPSQKASFHGQAAPLNRSSWRCLRGLLLLYPLSGSHRTDNGVTDRIRAQRRWDVSKASSERTRCVCGGGGQRAGSQGAELGSICFLQCSCPRCAVTQRPPFLPLASDCKQRCHWVLNTTQSENARA